MIKMKAKNVKLTTEAYSKLLQLKVDYIKENGATISMGKLIERLLGEQI